MTGTVARLAALVAGEGGPLAEVVAPAPESDEGVFGPLVTLGPRASEAPEEYALLLEAIFEGYLAHYAEGRVVRTGDADMRLLAGDYLYAQGLARLARLGDMAAVAELADLISLCARLHATTAIPDEPVWHAAGRLWGLCSLAIALGPWPEHAEAKRAVRLEGTQATERMERAARERSVAAGMGQELQLALIAFDSAVKRPFATK
jgi:hypothetical protein